MVSTSDRYTLQRMVNAHLSTTGPQGPTFPLLADIDENRHYVHFQKPTVEPEVYPPAVGANYNLENGDLTRSEKPCVPNPPYWSCSDFGDKNMSI